MLSIRQEEGVNVKKCIEDLPDNATVGTKIASEYLGYSMQTVRVWITKGYLPIAEITPSGKYRILVRDLKWFKDKLIQSAKEMGR